MLFDYGRAMSNSGNGHSTIIQLQPSGVELHVNLTYLAPQHGDDVLMYIENISKINQRAQNLKLASLGRFTASIAHEIRNPLAAISHAAQLLRESPDLISSDARFVAIIQSHANRMNDIIKNILELSRGRLAQPRQFAVGMQDQAAIAGWINPDNQYKTGQPVANHH